MSNQSDKDWQASLKHVENFDKKIKSTQKSAENLKGAFSSLATELLGISGAAFFTETSLSVDELIKKEKELAKVTNDLDTVNKKMADDMRGKFGDLESSLKKLSKTMSDDVSKGISSLKGVFNKEEIQNVSQINKLLEDANISGDKKKKLEDLRKAYIEDDLSYQEKNKKYIEEILKDNEDFMKHASEKDRFQAAALISQQGFNGLVEENLDLSGKILRLSTQNNGKSAAFSEIQMKNQIIAGELGKSVRTIGEELKKGTKEAFSLSKGFGEMTKNFAAGILPSLMKFDQVISDAGKNFGFIDTKSISSSQTMSSLGAEAARFNVDIAEATNMMGALGDELKTIDQNYLANSVKSFMAIEKAIGLSYEETGILSGEMMRTGKSAEEFRDFVEESSNLTKNFGVNIKKVMQGVTKNVDKMRQMGFRGGEESLTRMAIKAERLNMQMDEIFDVAKKARNIEGAMEMAADLQLAGGSFANIDPMSLLAAARKGPEELQKILTEMGGDIGTFNKDTGALEFDAVDIDRLQMVADATGQSLDSMQKGLMKSASDANKIKMFDGVTDGLDEMDAAMVNSGLADMMKVGKNGEIEFNASSDIAKRMGIGSLEELQSLSGEQIKEKMEADAKTLEEQAEANKSLSDSLESFKQALLSIFIQFEPVLSAITWAMNLLVKGLNMLPGWGKFIIAGLIGAFMLFGTKVGLMITQGFGSFAKSVKSLDFLKKIGKADTWKSAGKDSADKIKGVNSKDMAPKQGGKKGGGLESLSKGLAAMGGKNVRKGIGNTALAGPALAFMLPGMPTLGLMIAIGTGGALLEAGFKALSSGIASFGNKKNIWKGIVAVAAAGPALAIFAPALLPLALMIPLGLGGALIVAAFQSLSTGLSILGNNFSSVAKGAIALILVGASLIPFALAAQMMTGVDWLSVLAGVGVLGLVVAGLIGVGLLMTVALPFLLLGVAALIAVGAGLLIASVGLLAAGMAFQKLGEVNWDGISGMGSALMSSVPGLIAFSLASMMFLNPFTLLGMIFMIGTLGALSLVMIPLGSSMVMAADGMERFADGLEKLQQAANSLDLEKLEALKSLSFGMALASLGGGLIGDQIQKIAEALAALSGAGKGGSGGGNRKIEIDLKLNGRQIKEMIIDDTSIVS
jgi:hypothetical protein